MIKGIVTLKTYSSGIGNVYTVLNIYDLSKREMTEQEIKKYVFTKQIELLNYKFIGGVLTYTQGKEDRIIDQSEGSFAFVLHKIKPEGKSLEARGGNYDVYYETKGKAFRCKVSAHSLANSKMKLLNAKVVRNELGVPFISALEGSFETINYEDAFVDKEALLKREEQRKAEREKREQWEQKEKQAKQAQAIQLEQQRIKDKSIANFEMQDRSNQLQLFKNKLGANTEKIVTSQTSAGTREAQITKDDSKTDKVVKKQGKWVAPIPASEVLDIVSESELPEDLREITLEEAKLRYCTKVTDNLSSQSIPELLEDKETASKIGLSDDRVKKKIEASRFGRSLKRAIACGIAILQVGNLTSAAQASEKPDDTERNIEDIETYKVVRRISLRDIIREEVEIDTKSFGDCGFSTIRLDDTILGSINHNTMGTVSVIELINGDAEVVMQANEKIGRRGIRYWEVTDDSGNLIYKIESANDSLSKIRFSVTDSRGVEIFAIMKDKYNSPDSDKDTATFIKRGGVLLATISGEFSSYNIAINSTDNSVLKIKDLGIISICYIKSLEKSGLVG